MIQFRASNLHCNTPTWIFDLSSKNKDLGSVRRKAVRVKTARSRSSSSTRWLQRQLNDPYVAMAKKDGYRSRAAYKLKEIDQKYHLFKPNSLVIDLGAAPGSWSQIATETVREERGGRIIGVDLLDIDPLKGAEFIIGDFMDDGILHELEDKIEGKKVDVVLSDMAANATGHRQTDHLRIMGLLEIALDFAINHLKPGGSFLCKVLQGGTEKELLEKLRSNFTKVLHIKPKASRQDSAEMYVLAIGFKD